MKSHVNIFLKPFVQAVNDEISDIKLSFNIVKFYYAYGKEDVRYHEYNPGCLDKLISESTEKDVSEACIDIDLRSPKTQNLSEIKFQQNLSYDGKKIILEASNLYLDESFIVDYDLMKVKNVEELAKEYVQKTLELIIS